MLDKFSNKLLKKLNNLCDEGYKVLDKEELAESMHCSVVSIENNLKNFEDLGYIDIKYSDESVVCLATLVRARQEVEVCDDKTIYNKRIVKLLIACCVLSSVFAFLGALIGKLLLG